MDFKLNGVHTLYTCIALDDGARQLLAYKPRAIAISEMSADDSYEDALGLVLKSYNADAYALRFVDFPEHDLTGQNALVFGVFTAKGQDAGRILVARVCTLDVKRAAQV